MSQAGSWEDTWKSSQKNSSVFENSCKLINSLSVLPFCNTQKGHDSYFQQSIMFLSHWNNKHFKFIGVFLDQLFA